MKRIIYLLIPVLIALTVLSCKRDYDDDYMGNVDERLNATLTAYQNELTSAEHGWMANISTSEGIYRFWMKFYVNNGEVMNDLKGNRVTMITDNMNYDYSGVNGGTAVPGTSSFRLKALQRPTLIFDTDSYLAVLDSQRAMYSSQLNLISVRVAREQNLIMLYKALGGGVKE